MESDVVNELLVAADRELVHVSEVVTVMLFPSFEHRLPIFFSRSKVCFQIHALLQAWSLNPPLWCPLERRPASTAAYTRALQL